MRTLIRTVFTIALLMGLTNIAQAQSFTTPDWSNASTNNGPGADDFDTGTLEFQPVFSSSLTSINDPGTARYHDISGRTFTIEVRRNGDWVVIYSELLPGGSDRLLSAISTPINFQAGTIDGIRFDVDTPDSWSFHDFTSDNLTLTFNVVNRAVPSLSQLGTTILVVLLAGFGLWASRRRRFTT